MNEAMGDIGPELSSKEMAELSALADGTLPAERRAAVEARVAASRSSRSCSSASGSRLRRRACWQTTRCRIPCAPGSGG